MKNKDLNLIYIYLMAIFAIGITMSNIITFFGGVGFAFVGASVLLILSARKILNSADKKRFGDILVLVIIEFLMFIVLFFAYDFNINGITNKFPMIMRNICSIYSIIALGYVAFRYFSELKGKRYKVIEYILGNYTPEKKDKKTKLTKEMIKKNRELENGTLEPKPISVQAEAKLANPNNSQSSGMHHLGMARPVNPQSSSMVRPVTSQTPASQPSNTQPVNAQSVNSVNSANSQPTATANLASEQPNAVQSKESQTEVGSNATQQSTEASSQPESTPVQQSADAGSAGAKTNVMETIKNHPNYWD